MTATDMPTGGTEHLLKTKSDKRQGGRIRECRMARWKRDGKFATTATHTSLSFAFCVQCWGMLCSHRGFISREEIQIISLLFKRHELADFEPNVKDFKRSRAYL